MWYLLQVFISTAVYCMKYFASYSSKLLFEWVAWEVCVSRDRCLSIGSFEFILILICETFQCCATSAFRWMHFDFLHFKGVHDEFSLTLQICRLAISKKFPWNILVIEGGDKHLPFHRYLHIPCACINKFTYLTYGCACSFLLVSWRTWHLRLWSSRRLVRSEK